MDSPLCRQGRENNLGRPWIGFDLDKTLAKMDSWRGFNYIGPPIPQMIMRLEMCLKQGHLCKIFTARAGDGPDAIRAIQIWLVKQGIPPLEVTNVKDHDMELLYDDKARGVIPNTGEVLSHA